MKDLKTLKGKRIAGPLSFGAIDRQGSEALDDLVLLASTLFGTPIALVSLVDENDQWFAAKIGLDAPQAQRCISFCTHLVGGDLPLLVGDAHLDARFSTNPLVTGPPFVRAYAGVPLINHDGSVYGSLCVIDTQPRNFAPTLVEALQALARRTVGVLDALLHERQALRDANLLKRLLETMPDAVVTCDAHGQLEEFNSVAREWHGVDPRSLAPEFWADHFDLYELDGMTPLSTDRIPLLRAYKGENVREAEMVIAPSEGSRRLVSCNGVRLQAPSGELLGAVVTMRDITQERSATRALAEERRRLASVIDGTDVGTWEWNIQTGETRFNERWARIVGYALEEISPTTIETWSSLAHPEDLERSGRELELHFKGESDHYDFACRMRHKDGHWVWIKDRGRVYEWDAEGNPVWMAGAHFDITELVLAREDAELAASKFMGAFANAGHGMALVSLEGRWLDVNESLCRMLGYSRDQLLARTFQEITHPDDLDLDLALLEETLAGQRDSYHMDKRYFHSQGGIIEVLLTVSLVRHSDGTPLHFVSQIQNVSAQRTAERMLAQSELRLRTMLEAIEEPMVCFGAQGEIEMYNSSAASQLFTPDGLDCDELLPERSATFYPESDPDASLSWEELGAMIQGSAEMPSNLVMETKQGHQVPVTLQVSPIRDDSGEITGRVVLLHDVSHERERTRAARAAALTDPLTGLGNRRALEAAFPLHVPEEGSSLMLLDLDGFKQVNDLLGHDTGDRLLKEVAFVIGLLVRDCDLAVRLGGDEFAIVLTGCPIGMAATIAEALRLQVREACDAVVANLAVTASIGLVWVNPHTSLKNSIREADQAMYEAKRLGRNRVFFQPGEDVLAIGTRLETTEPETGEDIQPPDPT